MNYAELKKADVANGPGCRVSLFVSGCDNHCEGCFNKETWDFNFGKCFDRETMDSIISQLKKPYIKGLSILGGEPMHILNRPKIKEIVLETRKSCLDKTIWIYTGYLFEDLINGKIGDKNIVKEILLNTDVLVDGPFIESQKVPNLRFRGSLNQRFILCKDSIESGEIILWHDRR